MKKIMVLAAIVTAFAGFSAQADLFRSDWTTVRTLLVHDEAFGGCMARLEVDMREVSGNQCGEWVSFSCTNELLAPEQSQLLWDSIQLAYALKKDVRVQVDSNKKHNGHCVGKRIDFN